MRSTGVDTESVDGVVEDKATSPLPSPPLPLLHPQTKHPTQSLQGKLALPPLSIPPPPSPPLPPPTHIHSILLFPPQLSPPPCRPPRRVPAKYSSVLDVLSFTDAAKEPILHNVLIDKAMVGGGLRLDLDLDLELDQETPSPSPTPFPPSICESLSSPPTLPAPPFQVERTVLVDTSKELRDLLYNREAGVSSVYDAAGLSGKAQGNSKLIKEFRGR